MAALEIEDFALDYLAHGRATRALDGVDLAVEAGEVVGLIGESGSGKSTLAACVARLNAATTHVAGGDLRVEGRSVTRMSVVELETLRAEVVGHVFQDPVATMDPTMRIGRQVALAIRDRSPASPAEALQGMGFSDVGQLLASYPHQISGGMAQRVAVAVALARRPRIMIADEPTSALDASVKAGILALLAGRCAEAGVALLLVTHDVAALRRHAGRIGVMYAGRIIETGAAADVLDRPAHPYTRALLAASVGRERPGERLVPIPDGPPAAQREACAFAPRCAYAEPRCARERPEPDGPGGSRSLCLRAGSLPAPVP